MELCFFCLQSITQTNHLADGLFQQFGGSELCRSGDHIIGRLGAVDMVIGMDHGIITFLSSHEFDRTVSNDLVGVHIGRCTCAALNGIAEELVMQLSCQNLITGGDDGIPAGIIQLPHRMVTNGASLLDHSHCVNKLRAQCLPGNAEVFRTAQGLHAIISISRHTAAANGIRFQTHIHKMYSFLQVFCLNSIITRNLHKSSTFCNYYCKISRTVAKKPTAYVVDFS